MTSSPMCRLEPSKMEAKMSDVSDRGCWKVFCGIGDRRPLWHRFVVVFAAIFALTGTNPPAAAQAINIKHNVAPINQGNGNLCWAAATAMLLNWKVPGLHTMQSVASQGGPEFVTLYNNAIHNA